MGLNNSLTVISVALSGALFISGCSSKGSSKSEPSAPTRVAKANIDQNGDLREVTTEVVPEGPVSASPPSARETFRPDPRGGAASVKGDARTSGPIVVHTVTTFTSPAPPAPRQSESAVIPLPPPPPPPPPPSREAVRPSAQPPKPPIIPPPPPRPPVPPPPATTTATPPALTCPKPFVSTDKENAFWYPGLPQAPVKSPRWIGMEDTSDPKLPFRYTDGRGDEISFEALKRANALDARIQTSSRAFSMRIRDVKIFAPIRTAHKVMVQVSLENNGRIETITLEGKTKKLADNVKRVDVELRQPEVKNRAAFGGLLTCGDLLQGCKHILLRLDSINAQGKVDNVAYIVHRWGLAELTLSPFDKNRESFNRFKNRPHQALADYFSSTNANLCVRALKENKAGTKKLEDCAFKRLSTECALDDELSINAALSLGFRSWAVAYGQAEFIVTFSSAPYSGLLEYASPEVTKNFQLVFRGPLIQAKYDIPITVEGSQAKLLKFAYLHNNDGGGNLNLGLAFELTGSNDTEALTRISVSPRQTETVNTVEVEASIKQMKPFVLK